MSDSKVSEIKKNLATVTLGSFQEPTFVNSLGRLTGHRFKDPRVTYKVMKLSESINKEMQVAQKTFIETLKSYAKLDNKGNFVPKDDKPGTYMIQDGKEKEWEETFKKFAKTEACLNRKKLSAEELAGFDLSAADMDSLKGVIDIEDFKE